MAVKIRRLHCRVTVKTGGKMRPIMAKDEKRPTPSLAFAMPAARPRTEGDMKEPAASAIEEKGAAAGRKPRVDPRRVDPKLVADRVYDLMMKELLLSRERGEMRYGGIRR